MLDSYNVNSETDFTIQDLGFRTEFFNLRFSKKYSVYATLDKCSVTIKFG